jgi:hypothetical protein
MEFDIVKAMAEAASAAGFEKLTPEEQTLEAQYAAEWEVAYQKYSALRCCYEQCISQEEDPTRKQVLLALLDELNEENK